MMMNSELVARAKLELNEDLKTAWTEEIKIRLLEIRKLREALEEAEEQLEAVLGVELVLE